MQSVTQSLAGRTALFTLLPLSLSELGEKKSMPTDTLILNGGYPAVWGRGVPVQDFAKNYYQTYIERDVRQLIKIKALSKFQTFIRLCAGRIGTEFNASSLANAVGVSSVTINEWLSVLETAYVVFRLPPFHKNIGKRLVKKPKLYFYDTALACFLLNIDNETQLASHPLRGELFENMVILEFYKTRYNSGKAPNTYFYRDQSQREIDLLCAEGDGYHAYEIKSATAFHANFMKNFDYLRKVLGDNVLSTAVLYDGEQDIENLVGGVQNFRSAHVTNEYSNTKPKK
ncbi:MAG: AAA family ATPase [Gammaproteobacteria bacterium]|nr:MAG: AAA family ATPase [Gammaproteobacteria bacterium]